MIHGKFSEEMDLLHASVEVDVDPSQLASVSHGTRLGMDENTGLEVLVQVA